VSAPFTLPLDRPQPSQLYLSQAKFRGVLAWFDPADPSYDPVSVIELDDEWTLIDGHSRAFAAALAGHEDLRVVRDVDEHPRELYRECVSWCEDAGITSVGDLHGTLVSDEAYEELWLDRCSRAAEALDAE
jgi:hypothetical protein